MALINLVFHRIVQRNVGTALRPEWAHAEVPARITCDIPRVYERDSSQTVHLLPGESATCSACLFKTFDKTFLSNSNSLPVWTDDVELWERHPARCNVAYQP